MRLSLSALLLAFVLALPAQAQTLTITPKGVDRTLEVATWNIERFGAGGGPSDDAEQIRRVKAVLEQSGIDLWAVQEINNEEAFNQILTDLGDDFGGTVTGGNLGIGFIWRTAVVEPITIRRILTGNEYEFAQRPPLLLEANITTSGAPTLPISFIVIHAKCCGGSQDYDRRKGASEALKIELDFTSLSTKRVVVLGDFNDKLTDSIASGKSVSPYDNFLQDTANYTFLTLPLEEAGIGTFCGSSNTCGGSSTIDHIMVSSELASAASGDARRYEELLQELSPYASTTSDHLVVYARFDLGVFVANEAEVPTGALGLSAPFPNPASASTTIRYEIEAPSFAEIVVYDVLGRRAATLAGGPRAPGTYAETLDTSILPAGLYLVRLASGGQTRTLTLTVAR